MSDERKKGMAATRDMTWLHELESAEDEPYRRASLTNWKSAEEIDERIKEKAVAEKLYKGENDIHLIEEGE